MSVKNVIPASETKESINQIMPNDFAGNKQMIDNTDLGICCSICGYLSIAMVGIGWIIASSIALANSSIAEFQDDCSESNIWISLLVMIISVGLGMLDSWCGKRDENNKRQPNVIIMAVGLGSQIFSSIEVFDGCAMEKLNNTLVYQLQFWMVIIVYALYGILILSVFVLCCICCKEEAAYKKPNDAIEDKENVFASLDATLKKAREGNTVNGENNV